MAMLVRFGRLALALLVGACGHLVDLEGAGSGGAASTADSAGVAGSSGSTTCVTTWVCDDADGDGLGSSKSGAQKVWCGAEPRRCTDCDDSDPNKQQWAYLDADGDGTAAGQASECVPLPLPPGYSTHVGRFADCDDSDPAVQEKRGWDGDLDGYPSPGAQELCLPSDYADPHYRSSSRRDCDDSDPFVNPGMPEQRNDDLDSDCDGNLDPVDPCASDDPDYSYRDWPAEDSSAAASCAGQPDLFIDHIRSCERQCTGTVAVVLVVGNRGDTAFTGQVTLVARDEIDRERTQSVMLSVSPGELREVGSFFSAAPTVSLESPDDCDGGTAGETIFRTFIDCI